ncbi:DUF1648 domain-containing protein [Oceanobacillus neutriphilus]|uniref:DUF1648 domain-containing protein n=1 Tax=Oceanobacillus neutriphilus TaxID=531815 RepID=A0ABQ2NTK1_9BACI|nr:DUF1648 domain-containing protein [Oceanobacillus neutriphilus]GGP08167.1 hypothetical protein GCM10011346_07130 [Oceanobacillus neutriphilus]
MKKDFIVLLIMLIVLFVIILFLPDLIPIHFNWRGEADIVVHKYFLLFGVIIPYSVYWQFFREKRD